MPCPNKIIFAWFIFFKERFVLLNFEDYENINKGMRCMAESIGIFYETDAWKYTRIKVNMKNGTGYISLAPSLNVLDTFFALNGSFQMDSLMFGS